jgi:hypothetical protein
MKLQQAKEKEKFHSKRITTIALRIISMFHKMPLLVVGNVTKHFEGVPINITITKDH